MIKVYLASPFDAERRKDMDNAIDILRNKCFTEVYAPVEHVIPNAWDYPNDEWALILWYLNLTLMQLMMLKNQQLS